MAEKTFTDLRDLIVAVRKHIEASRRRPVTGSGRGKVYYKHEIEPSKQIEIGFSCKGCDHTWVMDMHAWGRWLRTGTPSQRQLIAILFQNTWSREGIAQILNQPDFMQSYYLTPFEEQVEQKAKGRTSWDRLDDDELV